MNRVHCVLESVSGNDLQRVVEPLAHYICATDQPKQALKSALSALLREVNATNRVATAHFPNFAGNRWS